MAPIGTVYSFALNTAATVRLDFMQRLIGRKLKGACVAQTRRNTRQRACVRLTRAGTLAFSLVLGAHKIHFDGRLSRSKRLLPGRYTLRLTATNAAGQRSRTRSLNFRVVR